MITQEFIKQNFPKGKLTLIGGRFAMGKTSLLTSLALSLARENQKSLYFSTGLSAAYELVKHIWLIILLCCNIISFML